MPFPQTFAALKEAGYRFDNHADCRGCHAPIEWWFTPKGRKLPFDPMPKDDSPAVAHFASCPNSLGFRSGSTSR